MAINKLKDIMSTEIKAPERSNFDRGSISRTWFSPGYVYPIGVIECIPNSKVSLDLDAVVKANPTIGSLYGTFRMSIQAFFVPSRLYVKELDQNNRLGLTNKELDSVRFPVIAPGVIGSLNPEKFNPSLQALKRGGYSDYDWNDPDSHDMGYNPAGSLMDNLRMLPPNFPLYQCYRSTEGDSMDNFGHGINAIPFIGYYDIYRNYYQNQQDDDLFVHSESNTKTFLHNLSGFTNSSYNNIDDLISAIYNRESDYSNIIDNTAGWNILSNDGWRYLVCSQFDSRTGIEEESWHVHSGYFRRTYDDDYFVSRLSSEYVDAIDSSSSVVVSNNTFNIQQLRLAQRNWRYDNKGNLANSQRYDDLLEVHYGARLNRELNIPHWLGSVSTDFYFEDVYAQASQENLGQRNGILNASLSGKDIIDVNIEEHGYILVLFSCIPRPDYIGAVPKMFYKDTFADVYKPEYDAVGYQDITGKELFGPVAINGDYVVGSQPAWFEYMTDFNHCHGRFTLDEKKFNTITRRWSVESPEDLPDTPNLTTYTEPWAYNYLFEETANWQDNFVGQFNVKFNVYQPMSKQIVSML